MNLKRFLKIDVKMAPVFPILKFSLRKKFPHFPKLAFKVFIRILKKLFILFTF
jgi:hypothetical protein